MLSSISSTSVSHQSGPSANNPAGTHFVYDLLKPLIESNRQQAETALDGHFNGSPNIDYLAEKTSDSIKNICRKLQDGLVGHPEIVKIDDNEGNPLALIEFMVGSYKEINVEYLGESHSYNISFDRLSTLLDSFNHRCSADIFYANPAHKVNIKPTHEELAEIHRNIDINLEINELENNDISCIVSALYMWGYDKETPYGYKCPESIRKNIQEGVLFDISPLMFAAKKESHIGKDPLMFKQHKTGNSSYMIELSPRDLLFNLPKIIKKIKSGMGDKCISLTSSGRQGHYFYYDANNDIVISGGEKAFIAGASGIGLEEYMQQKYSEIQKESIKFLFTNCTPEEIERCEDVFT